MRAIWAITVIASILILGTLGLSQDAFSGALGSPTIKITVDTIGGHGSFNFTIFNATNPANFTRVNIPDTFINNMSAPLPVQVGIFGLFSVIEDVPLNWNLMSSDCLINKIPHTSTLNFNLENGDTVECIFQNLFVPPPLFCVGNPCDDGLSCTIDTCDEVNDTCNNTPDNTLCDDDLFCNGSETCDAEIGCQDGTPPVSDDQIACTIDSCDETNSEIVNNPDDSQCIATSCTVGMCVEGVGCETSDVADGTVCEDIGVCMVGVCTFDEPPKVEICHKNKKTLSINPDSVDDHINNHDDIMGPCETEDKQKKVKEPKEEKQKKPKKSKK